MLPDLAKYGTPSLRTGDQLDNAHSLLTKDRAAKGRPDAIQDRGCIPCNKDGRDETWNLR